MVDYYGDQEKATHNIKRDNSRNLFLLRHFIYYIPSSVEKLPYTIFMTSNIVPYPAPAFVLPNQKGKLTTLDSFKGKWVILYFYPKNDTPGCTVEACSLRDARDDLAELGAEIVGVSKDDQSSHEKFRAKYSLNFTLLSDTDGKVTESYGAWGPKMFGKLGIQRKTFLIDPNGVVQKVYGRVTPAGHGDQIKKDLVSLRVNG